MARKLDHDRRNRRTDFIKEMSGSACTSPIVVPDKTLALILRGVASRVAKLGISLQEAARQMGFPEHRLSHFSTGQGKPSAVECKKIADWLKRTK